MRRTRTNVLRTLVLLSVLLLALVPGCSGVRLSAEYSELLDRTTALSAATAARAQAGEMTGDQMAAALKAQADTWEAFRAARDGRRSADRGGGD